MQGCNPMTMSMLTSEELLRMEECSIGERFMIKEELHEVTSVNPLVLHPLWDLV